MNVKLYNQLFKSSSKRIDSVKYSDSYKRNNDILLQAYQYWEGLREFRGNAKRCKMYVDGDQWGDFVETPEGRMRESEYIKAQGKVPLKNNRIKSLIRIVLGTFSSSRTEPVCIARDRDEQKLGEMMSIAVQYAYQNNSLWEVDRSEYRSFLITALAVFRTSYEWSQERSNMDVYVRAPSYERIFFDNRMEDVRHDDISFIGEIHDISLGDVLAEFSDGSRKKADYLRNIYRYQDRETASMTLQNLNGERLDDLEFFIPNDEDVCRVIEIWRKESKERYKVHDRLTGEWYKVEIEDKPKLDYINSTRVKEQSEMGVLEEDMKLLEYEWFVDRYWYFYFMSPYGDILKEGETPYWHKSHPYSIKIYPFFDGEAHSFVSEFIDQQRYINRLITLQDFIMGSAAKGVLLFPEECKPDGMKMEDVASAWVKYNGLILYKPKPGVTPPQQIISNASNSGVYDMLNIQLRLLDEVSGVSSALRGQSAQAGTPASLYLQQSQNSATSLIDVMESYRHVREARDKKIMKLQQQFYTDRRYINISGKDYANESKIFDPDKVRNIEFDLTLSEDTSTPTYGMVVNQMLMDLFKSGAINAIQLLENGRFPFADKLIQSIKSQQEQAEQAGVMQSPQVSPDIMQQIQQQSNPMIQQAANEKENSNV